jgi:hypothetical protein
MILLQRQDFDFYCPFPDRPRQEFAWFIISATAHLKVINIDNLIDQCLCKNLQWW